MLNNHSILITDGTGSFGGKNFVSGFRIITISQEKSNDDKSLHSIWSSTHYGRRY